MKSIIHHFKSGLLQAWASFTVLTKDRTEPAWARVLISTGIGLCFALLFTLVPGMILGRLFDGNWLAHTFGANLILCLCISYTIHALFRSAELFLPVSMIERLQARSDWRAGVFSAGVGIAGTALGGFLGLIFLGHVFDIDALGSYLSKPSNLRMSGFLTLLITGANIFWWKMRSKQQALQLAATEAQLRLLQAQIEPHFLFNTLANVQSLIDHDAARAKHMLESFTDYLRASLGQLRRADSSLGAELEMAQSYLHLLQIRMGERLSFSIEASAEARSAALPPLLLQPLIENAIHHGLEPKLEGGCIMIQAQVQQGRLQIRVEDDGLGLDAPKRPGRKGGAGIALGNIRARLESLYPHNASLSLTQQTVGTLAALSLPYTPSRSQP
ncbi:histidine kinase [Paucibacter sp. B2R-40]|uniref:sensor histidine kinase n=1 Tax=Paucibacter sp. B2R-40 TaxID=2893554 RepID=UPI0021E4809B|nr:histidine kinase [Paucibacter sp. B2R-40]MCV2355548.1 histidine kinase [Paucibacter sp. B2R-40]